VVLDKPPGLSSNRAQSRLKHLLSESKMGYLGTLDPLATGVLAVFVGKATKLIPAFEGLEKTYRCTLKLGQRTDTYDAEGQMVEERPIDGLTEASIREAILSFAGEYEQMVPRFSAVKVGGVPAYKLARKGAEVPERTRTVRLWDLMVQSVDLPHASFEVTCTSGTYIRSLVDDIGKKLGVGAHLTALRRVRCGTLFTLENSISLEGIEERIANGDSAMVRNPAEFLTDHWTLTLTPDAEQHLRDGRELPLGEASLGAADGRLEVRPGAKMKAVRPCGTLLAVGEIVARGTHALSFHPTKVLI
jgi:tRNA pseudouridine55 synthase